MDAAVIFGAKREVAEKEMKEVLELEIEMAQVGKLCCLKLYSF